MLKKLTAFIVVAFIAISVVGCSNKTSNKNQSDITHNKALITVYLPEGVKIDNKYSEDKNIAINYLPKNEKNFTKQDIDNIVNNVDKHVKLLVITTNKPGLEDVFKKVKQKLPGVVTVSANMEEMKNKDLYKILEDPNINIGFMVENAFNGVVTAKMAKLMNAKDFIYLYTQDYPNISIDMDRTKAYVESVGIGFKAIKVNTSGNIQDDVKKALETNLKDPSTTAVYPSNPILSEGVLDLALKQKFLIPNLNSNYDGMLLADKLGLMEALNKDSREKFDSLVSSKLKSIGLEGKIAGISEGRQGVAAELAIETSEYMYEKNLKLEDSYEDKSLVDRGNRQLNLMIMPENVTQANSYFRNLVLYPRIY